TCGVKPRPASSTSSRDAAPAPSAPGLLDSVTWRSVRFVLWIQPETEPDTRYQSPFASSNFNCSPRDTSPAAGPMNFGDFITFAVSTRTVTIEPAFGPASARPV